MQELEKIKDKTVNVTNGSRPANMHTEKQDGFFGKGKLHQIFKNVESEYHYTPYSKADSLQSVFDAKTKNKKSLLALVSEATMESQKAGNSKALADLFWDDEETHFILVNQTDEIINFVKKNLQ